MKQPPLYGLVCAGGGAHGAYQVGVLKYIHEHFSEGARSPFQVFAGASCGSLNTTFFAAQSFDACASRLWLEELWMSFHVPAYHGNILKNATVSLYGEWKKSRVLRRGAWALLSPKPMEAIIQKGFIRANLERSFREGTTCGVAVSATEILSGRSCWFLDGPAAKSWNLFHSMGILDTIGPAHVAASCSVPIFLPPVKIGDRYFLDGSMSLTWPLSASVSMGAAKIMYIATDKPAPNDLPHYPPDFRPRLSNVIGLLLNLLSNDTAAADEAIQLRMFDRFYKALSGRARHRDENLPNLPFFHEEALPWHYRPSEIYLFYPSRRIRQSSWITEDGTRAQTRRTTRFMFHEKFIRELIDLGYEDGRTKHEELKLFFSTRPAKKFWPFF